MIFIILSQNFKRRNCFVCLFAAYAVAVRPGLEQRDQLELRHSAAAFLFLGVPSTFN